MGNVPRHLGQVFPAMGCLPRDTILTFPTTGFRANIQRQDFPYAGFSPQRPRQSFRCLKYVPDDCRQDFRLMGNRPDDQRQGFRAVKTFTYFIGLSVSYKQATPWPIFINNGIKIKPYWDREALNLWRDHPAEVRFYENGGWRWKSALIFVFTIWIKPNSKIRLIRQKYKTAKSI